MPSSQNPAGTRLVVHTERELLVKILCELRVQTMILAQAHGISDEIGDLRNEVMVQGGKTATGV